MTCHALVVDDNPEIHDDVKDRLESLGHTCDQASSQEEAKTLLAKNSYAYTLLDLKIPVKDGRPSRITNGENLLWTIRRNKGFADIPVIMMASQGHYIPKLVVKVMSDGGANSFIMKPFPKHDRTLEKTIRKALRNTRRSHHAAKPTNDSEPPIPFELGELAFYPSRVELCGAKVCGSEGKCMIRRILDVLNDTDTRGRHRSFCGDELAGLVGIEGGAQKVAGSIRNFRLRVKRIMLTEAKVKIDSSTDVIITDRLYGYRFSDKIVVVDGQKMVAANQDKEIIKDFPKWILAELKRSGRVRRQQIAERTGHGTSTIRRNLAKLREEGRIVFEGSPRNGYWRLV